MAITYPLPLPGCPDLSSIKVTMQNLVATAGSEFTGAQQVQEWPGEWWEAEVALPYLTPDLAGQWKAFLAALRGQSGTFLMGPGGVSNGQVSQWTNLLRKNSQFDTWATASYLVSVPTVVANNKTDPLGGSTGDTVTFPSTTGSSAGYSHIYQGVNCYVYGQMFTASVYLKGTTGSETVRVFLSNAGSGEFYIQDFALTTSWQRYSFSAQFTGSNVQRSLAFGIQQVGSKAAMSVGMWGAQLERGTDTPGTYSGDFNPCVSGNSPGSKILTLKNWGGFVQSGLGWATGMTLFRAGDYVQAGNHLYMALEDMLLQSDNTCAGTVFPRLRTDATDGQLIYTIDPVGIWRLSENPRGWGVQPGFLHDISGIKCREAI